MPDINAIQAELRAGKLDGWLFCDVHHRDPIAYRVLELEPGMVTRRWFYLIPAKGEPRKLVHKIEPHSLDKLPGEKLLYSGRDELEKGLVKVLGRAKKLAMQYSPNNMIPYVAMVDAGTVDWIRSLKRTVVTSAELVQRFAARWSSGQFETHLQAARVVDSIMQQSFGQVASYVRQGKYLTEYALQQWILEQFRSNLLHTDDPPIVAVNAHSGDPHYAPQAGSSSPIQEGDFLLLDMWAKTRAPHSVYYDITWVGYVGSEVPAANKKIFDIVRKARDAAVSLVQDAVKAGRTIHGYEVDKAARDVIRKAGYGKYFVHRTGHNIGMDIHGHGANMDGLESKDDRTIIPHTCFSVEPGIYLPEFGVRSEVNVYVADRQARVTGAVQSEIIPILA